MIWGRIYLQCEGSEHLYFDLCIKTYTSIIRPPVIVWKWDIKSSWKIKRIFLFLVMVSIIWSIYILDQYDVIKWQDFPRYWPFVRGIHRSPVNSPHKGQWRGALMFSLICVWIKGWVNNSEAGDLRRYRAHYDVTAMRILVLLTQSLLELITEKLTFVVLTALNW